MSRVNPVDEGLIHAWIEGQVSPDDAARVERLVATDAEWGDAAAEARGLIAGASRVLGALDDVPMVARGGPSGTSSTSRTRSRAWSRSPWMRAAAGIVLVAGVASVVWKRADVFPRLDDSVRTTTTTNTAPEQVRVAERPEAALRQGVAAPGVAPVVRPTEPAPRQQKQERIANAPTPPRVPVVERGVVGASTVIGGADSNTGVAGSGGGVGGGRGIRGAAVAVADRNVGALEFAAKSAASNEAIDARLVGCWLASSLLQRTEESERRALAAREAPPLMKFIAPMVTDAATRIVTTPVTQSAAGARAAAPPASAAFNESVMRSIVNATVVRSPWPDSTFTAEWMDQRGRTLITFAVRGDTLRGTVRASLADSTGSPFAATRVACPR